MKPLARRTTPTAQPPRAAVDPGSPSVQVLPTPPDPIDPALVRRHALAATLPCLSITLLKQLQPLRFARFDPAQATTLILDDPALLLATYAQAARAGWRDLDPDPAAVVERLGPDGIVATIDRLRAAAPPKDPAALAALLAGYRHALAAARLAALLAPELRLNPRIAAAAALLHDIGRLALLAGPLAPRVLPVYVFAQTATLATTYLEQTLLGATHKQLGVEFAARLRVPAVIAAACDHHDHHPAQRSNFDDDARPLAALVAACNQVAKAHGLSGCTADELRNVPPELQPLIIARSPDIKATLAEVRDLSLHRWTPASPPPAAPQPLTGITLALTCPETRWSPFAAALRTAGATVIDVPWTAALPPAASLLILDATDTPLSAVLPMLTHLDRLASTLPRVILADRCQEPEARIRSTPLTTCCSTPLRLPTLIATLTTLLASPPARAAA